MENKTSYQELINTKGKIIVTPVGVSMMPLIRQGKDTVLISKITQPLKKYDVVLFVRPDGKHVLHRIIKVKKNGYNICGDNQVIVEKNVPLDWIIGVMEGFYRDEDFIPITDINYIKYSKKRVKNRKYRFIVWFIKAAFRKIFKKKNKRRGI